MFVRRAAHPLCMSCMLPNFWHLGRRSCARWRLRRRRCHRAILHGSGSHAEYRLAWGWHSHVTSSDAKWRDPISMSYGVATVDFRPCTSHQAAIWRGRKLTPDDAMTIVLENDRTRLPDLHFVLFVDTVVNYILPLQELIWSTGSCPQSSMGAHGQRAEKSRSPTINTALL